jgi:transcriptional regulator with XRE-family HTH domain
VAIHDDVREERVRQGMSLSKLARLAEVNDGNLSRFERGQAWMREDSLQRVLSVLGLKLVRIDNQGPSGESEPDTSPLEEERPPASAASVG